MLLCPSWSEGLPNVILEGMANGLAILTTDVGASAILTNQQNGWLLSEPSVEKIVKTLQEIEHCSKADLDKKKQSSLERIKSQFTWEKLIKVLLQVIEERKLIQ